MICTNITIPILNFITVKILYHSEKGTNEEQYLLSCQSKKPLNSKSSSLNWLCDNCDLHTRLKITITTNFKPSSSYFLFHNFLCRVHLRDICHHSSVSFGVTIPTLGKNRFKCTGFATQASLIFCLTVLNVSCH